MRLKHVVVYRTLQDNHLDMLRKDFQVSYYPSITDDNRDSFLSDLKTADGLLGAGMKISSELLDQAKQLRVISNFSAGYDNVDLDELTSRGIIATNVPDALTDSVADLIFSSLLSSARRISELDRFVRNGSWEGAIGEEQFGTDVHHRTIGIVGMGRIGRKLAQRAALGFDMNVVYHKRQRDLEAERTFHALYCADLKELLDKSDFICLTLPLTKETKHMISHSEFRQMKPTAILVNGARGPVVDEKALIQALKGGVIRGAGLDVFEKEPLDSKSELIQLDNVVLTPHIGSATKETRARMVEQGIKNLFAALNGERPINLLNKEVFVKD